ncbi:MAG TPA: hypothetical protein VGE50_10635, partial [Gammaproteobacteria bacterium]
MKEKTGQILAQLPVEVAAYLLNEKRAIIAAVEARQGITVTLVPNPHLHTPHYEIQRIRADELDTEQKSSYELITRFEEEAMPSGAEKALLPREEPAVKGVTPSMAPPPSPAAAEAAQPGGFLTRLFSSLFGAPKAEEPVHKERPAPTGRAPREREERRETRGGQEQRRRGVGKPQQQQRTERPERAERLQREPRPQPEAAQRKPQQPPKPRPVEKVREEVEELEEVTTAGGEFPAQAAAEGEGQEQRGTRRGRRGGRRRGGRSGAGTQAEMSSVAEGLEGGEEESRAEEAAERAQQPRHSQPAEGSKTTVQEQAPIVQHTESARSETPVERAPVAEPVRSEAPVHREAMESPAPQRPTSEPAPRLEQVETTFKPTPNPESHGTSGATAPAERSASPAPEPAAKPEVPASREQTSPFNENDERRE